MNRDIYRRIANLNTKGGEKIFDAEIKNISSILKDSQNYDEILEALDSLKQFAFRRHGISIGLVQEVLSKKELSVKTRETIYGNIKGANYGDMVEKCLEILDDIRYLETPKIIRLYRDLYKVYDENSSLGKKLRSNINNISEYSYQVVLKIGISPQVEILKVLHMRNIIKNKDLDFYLEVVGHIANIEVTNQRMSDVNTLSLGWGILNYSQALDSMRKGAIEKLFSLMSEVGGVGKMLAIADTLDKFVNHFLHDDSSVPSRTAKMLLSDRILIYGFYYNLLQTKVKNTNIPLPLFLRIEEYTATNRGITSKRYEQILDKIEVRLSKIEIYNLYKIFFGDGVYLRTKDGEYVDKMDELKAQRQQMLDSLDDSNISKFGSELNFMLSFEDEVASWKFHEVNLFFVDFAKQKSGLAFKLISNINYPFIFKGIGFFSIGFAQSNDELFYETVDMIAKNENLAAVYQLCIAIDQRTQTEVDANILKEISQYSGRFDYIANQKKQYIIGSIAASLVNNFGQTNNESLLLSFIRNNQIFGSQIIDSVSLSIRRTNNEKIDFSVQLKAELEGLMIKEETIDYKSEYLLSELLSGSAADFFSFFEKRIKRAEALKAQTKKERYYPVPYRLDKVLVDVVNKAEDYDETVLGIFDSLGEKWTLRDMEISNLVRRTAYKRVLLNYIDTLKGDSAVTKMLNFYALGDSAPLDIVMLLVGKTSSKSVWESAYPLIYSTGVVSGEYGLANAHKAKAQQIRSKYLGSNNENIKAFSEKAIKYLEVSAEEEVRRTDERNKLMKTDFERGN